MAYYNLYNATLSEPSEQEVAAAVVVALAQLEPMEYRSALKGRRLALVAATTAVATAA
jgi:hypothetical protein